jgi:hypothetical protein
MNDVAMPVTDAAVGTELAVLNQTTALLILQDEAKSDAFYEKVKAEVTSHVPDLTTDKGRKAIASLAFKVTKTKTALDAARKQLTEEKRKEIAAVDAAGKRIRDRLDELAAEVRQPLTEWEAAEEARVARCQQAIQRMKDAAVIRLEDTSGGVAARLAEVEGIEVSAAEFGDLLEFATDAKAAAVGALTAGRDRLAQEEADRAELARLRQEAEERAAREAAEAAERQRAEQEAADARRREEEARTAAEAAEKARQAAAEQAAREAGERAAEALRAAEEAATAAAREAEGRMRAEAAAQAQQAQAERERLEREHQEQLAAAAQARAAAEAEAQRLAAERAEEARRRAEEQAAAEARVRDVEHRGGIMRAAKEALMEHAELEEPAAKAVVLAIAANSIPAVSIRF